jgi:toxin-antitoxin system PIN domain toxin
VRRALLDVNVLLGLIDVDHVEHARVRAWVDQNIEHGWASCAITQNGFVRVISQPRYTRPVAPAEAIRLLERAVTNTRHAFWLCEARLLDPAVIDRSRIHGPRQVTDAYLLALAKANGGRFVTLDASVPVSAVVGARSADLVVL